MEGPTTHMTKGQWKSMLEKADELLSSLKDDEAFIPRLKRDLSQLESATSHLRREEEEGSGNMFSSVRSAAEESKKRKDFQMTRANRLLGQYSFDADRLERELAQIVPRPQEELASTSMEHHLQVVATTIHEALMTGVAETEHQAICQLEDEWEMEKRGLLEELKKSEQVGRGMKERNLPTSTSMVAVVARTPTGNFASDDNIVAYDGPGSQRVANYLNATRAGEKETLVVRLANIDIQDNLPSSQYLWSLVREINEKTQTAPDDRNAWFLGARTFLEDQYKRNIVQFSFTHQASSTRESVVRFLVQVKSRRGFHLAGSIADDLLRYTVAQSHGYSAFAQGNGSTAYDGLDREPIYTDYTNGEKLPLWAVVYYCLRIGGWGDAVQLLEEQSNDLHPIGKQIKNVLQALVRNQNSNDARARLDELCSDVSSLQKFSPWKRALLYMLLQRKNGRLLDRSLNSNVQDYMWMKLSILLAMPENSTEELLVELRNVFTQSGPQHFSEGGDPQLFARLLLMVKLPLQAVRYLADVHSMGFARPFIADAVHVGLCLSNYFEEDELCEFIGLLEHYGTMCFAQRKPRDAIFYVSFLLKHPSVTTSPAVNKAIVRALVSFLVGKSYCHQNDLGTLLEDFDDSLRKKVLVAAGDKAILLPREDREFVAIDFYLCEEASLENALRVMNRHIARAILPKHVNRDKWERRIRDFNATFTSDNSPRPLHRTFGILQNLLRFTKCMDEENFKEALGLVDDVLPLHPDKVDRALRDFYNLDEVVYEIFPYVFEQALSALKSLHSTYADNAKRREELKMIFSAFQSFNASLPDPPKQISKIIARFYH